MRKVALVSHRMPRLGLFAKEDIPAGDEITYNYSVKWFGDPSMAQRCYCAAPNCTGYLGPAPSTRPSSRGQTPTKVST